MAPPRRQLNSAPCALTAAAISVLSGARSKSSLPSRRHRAWLPPPMETATGDPARETASRTLPPVPFASSCTRPTCHRGKRPPSSRQPQSPGTDTASDRRQWQNPDVVARVGAFLHHQDKVAIRGPAERPLPFSAFKQHRFSPRYPRWPLTKLEPNRTERGGNHSASHRVTRSASSRPPDRT